MNALYLDSSALLRRYAARTGGEWISSVIASGAPVYLSALSVIETTAAIARLGKQNARLRRLALRALGQFRRDLNGYRVLAMTDQVVERAITLAESGDVRGADAVHLSTALIINETLVKTDNPVLTFISADLELDRAAEARGLVVDNPDDHPENARS